MEETVFPPSPSWFLPNIISARKDGSVSYGSKNNIVILKSLNKKLEMLIIHNAHSLRVTGVAFSPPCSDESIENTVVSCSEDGFVKLWNINTRTATIGHKTHGEKNGEAGKVISLDWSAANPYLVVSAAENNSLVLWNIVSNTTTKFSFQKLGPTVISCCPYNEKIVAVGGKTGQIFIISLSGNGNILYKLRGHDNKIHTLSWCPVPYNVFKTDDICEEFLLASACQNKEVFIWRAGSDGKCEINFQIPTNALIKRDSSTYGKVKNSFSFAAVCWLEPYKIYFSSNFGELLYFDIKFFISNKTGNGGGARQKSNKLADFFKLGHYHHTKGLFAIAGSPAKGEVIMCESMNIKSELKFINENNNLKITKRTDSENGKTWEVVTPESSSILWTAGQDRKLVGCKWKSSQMKLMFNYNTINGTVYSIVVSPHDPNKVAIGAGDGMIRLWNLTETNGDLQVYWQKIKDRVMSLAWHPTKDGLLAYGTSEGRVGVVDTKSNKFPNVFKPSHPQPIYSLSWGPKFPAEGKKESTSNSDFDLYAVGDNTLSLYNPLKLNSDPLNLSKIIPFPCKKQTDICYKPDYSLMAVGNEDGSICLVEPSEFKIVHTVFAYKKLIESIAWHPLSTALDMGLSPCHGYFTSGSTDNSCEIKVFNCKKEEDNVKVEQVALLKGHHGNVQSVAWCPHISGRLISTSVDSSVQIWNVISQTPLVNFTPDGMPVFSIWSPVDPDFILTGCKNDVLCIWRVSVQTEVQPSAKTKIKKSIKEKNVKIGIAKDTTIGDGKTDNHPLMGNEDNMVSASETKGPTNNSKETKMFSKFWKGGEEEEFKVCYSLLNKEKQTDYLLPFFGEEIFFHESLRDEEESCRKANKWTEVYELALWNGNLKSVLEERIKTGQLNDFLVSLAPAVSPKLWQDACRAYSKALLEKKYYRKAASYLLVCHNIFESINLLMDAHLYLEALCIARSRLPSSDPILGEIIRKYGEWLYKNGSILKACECYLYLGDYLEVAKICSKKNEPHYSSLAALAAKKCNCFDLQSLEAVSAIFKCFEKEDIELARQICKDNSNLKILSLIFHIYHIIHKLEAGEIDLKINILSHIRETFKTTNWVFPSSAPLLFNKYVYYKNRQEVLSIITQELTIAFCAKKSDDIFTHLIRALSTCSRYTPNSDSEVHPLCNLCHWLSPLGYLSPFGFFTCQNLRFYEKVKSLRAFLCASIIRHVTDNRETPENTDFFDILRELQNDLMDKESYNYFKNLLQVEICEKRILKNRSLLSQSTLSEKTKVLNLYELEGSDTESEGILSEAVSAKTYWIDSTKDERELACVKMEPSEMSKFDNEAAELTKRLHTVYLKPDSMVESKEDQTLTGSYRLDEEGNIKSDKISEEGSINSDINREKILEEKIFRDLNLLAKLRSEIETFETERVSAPNPVPNYFLLKKFCEGFPHNKIAVRLLKELEEKWKNFY